ncbi:MAG: serine/threonine-protein kinase [Gemmatimonadota bacterium]
MPGEALYCTSCGLATPTAAVDTEGRIEFAELPDAEVESRARLQLALGDGFEVRELLGRGGFGLVFTAFDRRLKRDLAVKVLRLELALSGTFMDRFEREAMTAAQLRHPNIVPIYAIGEKDGLAYIVMPLIRGETLQKLLERDGPLPIAETCRILTDAASALAAAHAVGLIHRDIKPDNIMLEGADRRVLLMDFGIAKMVRTSDANLTGTGVLIGTPLYMSPEQGSGDRDMDQRSDIYSFGVVAYHMVTGKPPFAGSSGADLIRQHVLTPATDVRVMRPSVPPALARAVMRCLSKDRERRWQSAEDLRVALQAASRAQESGIAQKSLFSIGRGITRMLKPLAVALAIAIPVALVVLLRKPTPALPVAVAPLAPSVPDPVDSLLLAARGAATYSRQRAVTAGAQPEQLRAGDSVMARADSLAGFGRKAEAAVLLTTAAGLWEKSERPIRSAAPVTGTGRGPGPVPAGTSTRSSPGTPSASGGQPALTDSVAVANYYGELTRAIASRQLGEVRRLLPNLSSGDERTWRNLFEDKDVDGIDVSYTVITVTRRDATAYARIRLVQQVSKKGRTQEKSKTMNTTLTLGPQGWREIRTEQVN